MRQNIFEESAGQLMITDESSDYIYVDECSKNINKVLDSKKKFVFFIRDPIYRAFAAWHNNTVNNMESETFEDCIDRELNLSSGKCSFRIAEYHYIKRGFYLEQIERILKVFQSPENILIVIVERFQKDPTAEYDRICKFLGTDEVLFKAVDGCNQALPLTLKKLTKQKLLRIYAPHNKRLFHFLGKEISEWCGYSVKDKPKVAVASCSVNSVSSDSYYAKALITDNERYPSRQHDSTYDSRNNELMNVEVAVPNRFDLDCFLNRMISTASTSVLPHGQDRESSYWVIKDDGSFYLQRNHEAEPYWLMKNPPFWGTFIQQYDKYDHVYLFDIFKVICGDAGYRRLILQHFTLYDFVNDFDSCNKVNARIFIEQEIQSSCIALY
eukprot:CAMPEP_0170107228 /NCGR_PEP_ID=MMETSP0020_2-20130122/5852_1 /TAXON_ID=98059 /ORGANISM="Dinobryon sp., Strain UTEXLB2267" /LENGTH=382 /DNA_ID=CAMNT_0010331721 /DNA_START=146 /DNA_END=1295 /DNA_ORIENTATION=+